MVVICMLKICLFVSFASFCDHVAQLTRTPHTLNLAQAHLNLEIKISLSVTGLKYQLFLSHVIYYKGH